MQEIWEISEAMVPSGVVWVPLMFSLSMAMGALLICSDLALQVEWWVEGFESGSGSPDKIDTSSRSGWWCAMYIFRCVMKICKIVFSHIDHILILYCNGPQRQICMRSPCKTRQTLLHFHLRVWRSHPIVTILLFSFLPSFFFLILSELFVIILSFKLLKNYINYILKFYLKT